MKKLILTTVLSLSTISAFAHICEGTFQIQENSHKSCENELTIREYSLSGKLDNGTKAKVLLANSNYSINKEIDLYDLMDADLVFGANFQFKASKHSENAFKAKGSMKGSKAKFKSSYVVQEVRQHLKNKLKCTKSGLKLKQSFTVHFDIPVISIIPLQSYSQTCNYKRI